jgi:hypothetical protein
MAGVMLAFAGVFTPVTYMRSVLSDRLANWSLSRDGQNDQLK